MSSLNIILGGVSYAALLRDGSIDEVKVRQLPIDLIDQWASLQGDEAGLVELYCDRQVKGVASKLQTLRVQEGRLLELLGKSEPDQFDGLEERLTRLRERIETLEREQLERWDAKLLPESHDEILRIGEELNRPIFDRWMQSRTASLGRMKRSTAKMQELMVATSDGGSSPSPTLQPSAASSSGSPT